jgi:hypothetical protein
MLSDELYEDYRAYFEDQRRARELLGAWVRIHH